MDTLDAALNLYTHYAQTEEITHYYGLLAQYGLLQAADEKKDPILLERCKKLLSRYPDQVKQENYNFACYRIGGNAAAWADMKGIYTDHRKALEQYGEQMLSAEKDKAGILCLPGGGKDGLIWIDVAAAVTPFMLFSGLTLNREDFLDFGASQTLDMYEAFKDPANGLLHQSRGFLEHDRSLCSQDHWSRGNGWGYLALTELAAYLPENSKYREKAESCYRELSQALLPYQTQNGLWRQEITENLSWEESSGTALILYGMGAGLRLGILDRKQFTKAYTKGIHGLIAYGINDDFSTNLCCPGCLCPGKGAARGTIQAYMTEVLPVKDEHHSFGSFMLALVEAYRNGWTKIDWSTRTLAQEGSEL